MTSQEFIEKFPVGSLISYVPGQQYVNAGAREIFRIDGYSSFKKIYLGEVRENWFMRGMCCCFNFMTTRYKKEYTPDDRTKWHCIDCSDDVMMTSLGTLCHKFNDVRLADSRETELFNECFKNMER